mgnify:CR=1 FL=1
MSKERNDWRLPGTIVAALVILAILGNMERVTRETLSAQLTDTQRQIADLENNISSLAIRNIDMQQDLQDLKAQLRQARAQAEEVEKRAERESKRQRREQWLTTIVGLVGGWVLGRKELSRIMIFTRRILSRLRGIVTGSFADGGRWIPTMNNNSLNRRDVFRSRLSMILLIITLVSFSAGIVLLILSL